MSSDFFGSEFEFLKTVPQITSRLKKVNPMILTCGEGPKDKRCRDCIHLRSYKQSTSWFKCMLRKNTGGAGTDHRALWETCSLFKAEKGGR